MKNDQEALFLPEIIFIKIYKPEYNLTSDFIQLNRNRNFNKNCLQ